MVIVPSRYCSSFIEKTAVSHIVSVFIYDLSTGIRESQLRDSLARGWSLIFDVQSRRG